MEVRIRFWEKVLVNDLGLLVAEIEDGGFLHSKPSQLVVADELRIQSHEDEGVGTFVVGVLSLVHVEALFVFEERVQMDVFEGPTVLFLLVEVQVQEEIVQLFVLVVLSDFEQKRHENVLILLSGGLQLQLHGKPEVSNSMLTRKLQV